ncbi:hypothetical protein VFPFJ_01206 [Purpureocillium lilacinum]|uniref:Uncharacterized protein n=1 Tax=Purpureocillium lilacinum TaxID=33203 RepID=A0A179HXH9_PURLI|nr:hypothetical protein VFPFJ_01206 [Purpureocillium lilacinum]OAQ95097.1 hypothetical protein VFPFJ_01206 [Purpureocillium lilacinum]
MWDAPSLDGRWRWGVVATPKVEVATGVRGCCCSSSFTDEHDDDVRCRLNFGRQTPSAKIRKSRPQNFGRLQRCPKRSRAVRTPPLAPRYVAATKDKSGEQPFPRFAGINAVRSLVI